MKYIATSIICLIAGFFIGRIDLHRNATPQELSAKNESPQFLRETIAQQKTRLQEEQALTANLKSLITNLESDYETLATSIQAKVETETTQNQFFERSMKMATTMASGRHEANIVKLKSTLNLSPEQVISIENFYAKQDSMHAATMKKVLQGASQDDIQKEITNNFEDSQYFTLDQLLEDQLSPEQATVYENLKKIEEAEQKEATANSELARIQRIVSMTEDQKDAVFSIFHEQNYKLNLDDVDSLNFDPTSPDSFLEPMKIENTRLLSALSAILDPTQLEIYTKQTEQDLKMLEASTSMMTDLQAE